MASYANLVVDQGADFETVITLEDERSDPINLTGYVLAGQIRRTYKSTTVVNFELSFSGSPANGLIRIRLPSSSSAAMKFGRYVYDIYARNNVDGKTYKVLEGMLEIVPRVTRSVTIP
jgi:hypothetical protein